MIRVIVAVAFQYCIIPIRLFTDRVRIPDPLRRSFQLADLTHLQRIRQDMIATTSHIYLNAGTFGPLPACVPAAVQERMQQEWQDGRLGMSGFERMRTIYEGTRQGAARLLNADVDEIALTDNTGEGLNIISFGI